MTPYCTRDVSGMSMLVPCPDCGHPTHVHPMYVSPAVTHCLLCEIEHLTARLRRSPLGQAAKR